MFNEVDVWWMGSNFYEGNSLLAKLSPEQQVNLNIVNSEEVLFKFLSELIPHILPYTWSYINHKY